MNKTKPAPKNAPSTKTKTKSDETPQYVSDEIHPPIPIEPANQPETVQEQPPHKNSVGQKLDKPITKENDVYLTPENERMIVQMDDGERVFAGEHGKKAHWFDKEIVKTWVKQN